MTEEARAYIQQHERIIAPLHKDYSLTYWDLSLNGNDEALEKAVVAAKERFLKVYNNRDEFRQIREWQAAGIQLDEIDARQLKLIHDAFVPQQIEPESLHDIVERETQIEN